MPSALFLYDFTFCTVPVPAVFVCSGWATVILGLSDIEVLSQRLSLLAQGSVHQRRHAAVMAVASPCLYQPGPL
jgi:hypothetical protein